MLLTLATGPIEDLLQRLADFAFLLDICHGTVSRLRGRRSGFSASSRWGRNTPFRVSDDRREGPSDKDDVLQRKLNALTAADAATDDVLRVLSLLEGRQAADVVRMGGSAGTRLVSTWLEMTRRPFILPVFGLMRPQSSPNFPTKVSGSCSSLRQLSIV